MGALEASRDTETGQEASKAAPVLGAMAGQGTRAAMADRGAWVAMVDPETQEAMAERGARAAMAGQGTREAMAKLGWPGWIRGRAREARSWTGPAEKQEGACEERPQEGTVLEQAQEGAV